MPLGIYSYDLKSNEQTTWERAVAVGSKPEPGAAPLLVRYPTFDGRTIPAFVRRPTAEHAKPSPVLIMLHDGPARQYRPRYSPLDEYLVDALGIAVVHPNVRGSTGYGRSFQRLDDGPLREGALKDVGALLDWIATQPDLDGHRVAVAGLSHGGLLALAALAKYGERLRAGIDLAGPSNLETYLQGQPASELPYWRSEYGDERDPSTLEFLHAFSPLIQAAKIRKPLLVVHGIDDPTVPVLESDRIVAAAQDQATPVWYVRLPQAGLVHGLGEDQQQFVQLVEIMFLKRYLLQTTAPSAPAPMTHARTDDDRQ
jgi:dipeptidyl aminopeptidase/acylaminoacyl peptidase